MDQDSRAALIRAWTSLKDASNETKTMLRHVIALDQVTARHPRLSKIK
jgi:hypothetical protein